MTRPEGTNECKEEGCKRGTLTEYCRKHRRARGLQGNGQPAPTELKVTLDEIIEQVGRHVWEAAVEEAIAKKRGEPAPKKRKKAA